MLTFLIIVLVIYFEYYNSSICNLFISYETVLTNRFITFMFIHFSRFIHNDIQMRIIPAQVINSRGKKKITEVVLPDLIQKHAEMQILIIIMMIMIVMHVEIPLKNKHQNKVYSSHSHPTVNCVTYMIHSKIKCNLWVDLAALKDCSMLCFYSFFHADTFYLNLLAFLK